MKKEIDASLFSPEPGNVLFRVERETMTKGGIHIPGTARERDHPVAIAIKVSPEIGEDGFVRPTTIKSGDLLVFAPEHVVSFIPETDRAYGFARLREVVGVVAPGRPS